MRFILILATLFAFNTISFAQKQFERGKQEPTPANLLKCLQGFSRSYNGFRANLPKSSTPLHNLNAHEEKFDQDPKKEFLSFDETLQSGRIKKTILTAQGEFSCIYDKEYKDSAFVDLNALISRKYIFKSKPKLISFSYPIKCKKNNGLSDRWVDFGKGYLSLLPSFYDIEIRSHLEGSTDLTFFAPEAYLESRPFNKSCHNFENLRHSQLTKLSPLHRINSHYKDSSSQSNGRAVN